MRADFLIFSTSVGPFSETMNEESYCAEAVKVGISFQYDEKCTEAKFSD